MSAPREILEHVARFEQQLDAYKSGQYNESQVRRIDNDQGFAEAYKDVMREDQIRVGGVVKAADYCFCIGGTRKYAALDTAVLTAYGFSAKKDLLAQLLALNQQVAANIERGEPVAARGVPKNYPDAKQLVTVDCTRPNVP